MNSFIYDPIIEFSNGKVKQFLGAKASITHSSKESIFIILSKDNKEIVYWSSNAVVGIYSPEYAHNFGQIPSGFDVVTLHAASC